MEFRYAKVLLEHAVALSGEVRSEDAKKRMADAVITLRDIIPEALTNAEDRQTFLEFAASVEGGVADARACALRAETGVNAARCLNTGTAVDCGGPPTRLSKCDLCGRRGRL